MSHADLVTLVAELQVLAAACVVGHDCSGQGRGASMSAAVDVRIREGSRLPGTIDIDAR